MGNLIKWTIAIIAILSFYLYVVDIIPGKLFYFIIVFDFILIIVRFFNRKNAA